MSEGCVQASELTGHTPVSCGDHVGASGAAGCKDGVHQGVDLRLHAFPGGVEALMDAGPIEARIRHCDIIGKKSKARPGKILICPPSHHHNYNYEK